MTFDSLALAAVADELRGLGSAKVQRVVQSDALTIGLELFDRGGRHWLLASASSQRPRVFLTPQRIGQAVDSSSPILLLLRKYVRGARLVGVHQPAYERVVVLDFVKILRAYGDDVRLGDDAVAALDRPDDAEDVQRNPPSGNDVTWRVSLIIEVIGRLSNVVLIDEAGLVMDALKRIPSTLNRYRVTLPHRPYVPPPPQAKRQPVGLSGHELATLLQAEPSAPVWQLIVSALAGLSPQTAREISFRATGSHGTAARDADPECVHAALLDILAPLSTGGWQPSIATSDGVPVAFAPYELHHLGTFDRVPTLSRAAELFYAADERHGSIDQARAVVRRRLDDEIDRWRRRVSALEEELTRGNEAEQLREAGDLILTHLTAIQPGQSVLRVDDRTIELNPMLRPSENAQQYYRRYGKARDAVAQVPELRDFAAHRVRYFEEQLAMLELATSREEVEALDADLAVDDDRAPRDVRSPGGRADIAPRRPDRRSARPATLRMRDFDILVGRTGRQNDDVTFRLAAPTDYWLHARGVPGAHVIVRARGGNVPDDIIQVAAGIAAHHSQLRDEPHVPVDVTRQRYVRRIKGAPPGLVTYSGETTFRVAPVDPARLTTDGSRRNTEAPSTGHSGS